MVIARVWFVELTGGLDGTLGAGLVVVTTDGEAGGAGAGFAAAADPAPWAMATAILTHKTEIDSARRRIKAPRLTCGRTAPTATVAKGVLNVCTVSSLRKVGSFVVARSTTKSPISPTGPNNVIATMDVIHHDLSRSACSHADEGLLNAKPVTAALTM